MNKELRWKETFESTNAEDWFQAISSRCEVGYLFGRVGARSGLLRVVAGDGGAAAHRVARRARLVLVRAGRFVLAGTRIQHPFVHRRLAASRNREGQRAHRRRQRVRVRSCSVIDTHRKPSASSFDSSLLCSSHVHCESKEIKFEPMSARTQLKDEGR